MLSSRISITYLLIDTPLRAAFARMRRWSFAGTPRICRSTFSVPATAEVCMHSCMHSSVPRVHHGNAARERVELVLVGGPPEESDVPALRHRHLAVTHEHQRRASAAGVLPARERIEQLTALLALDDAADIEEVRALDRVALPE